MTFRKALLASLIGALAFGVANADLRERGTNRVRAPIRAYVGATPQQYDTLECTSGFRVVLTSFAFYADDSAMTPVLNVYFVSKNSKTIYGQLRTGFAANEVKSVQFPGLRMAFPPDTTVLVYYNITGATPGTIDTLVTSASYTLEGW